VIAIVFGVSGAGKTTIGKLLAQELGWRFYEADDLHSQANIDKLRRGIPLTSAHMTPISANIPVQYAKSAAASVFLLPSIASSA
jgi:gluconokinase